MMSSARKSANALNIFNWKWHREDSSLTKELLYDVPPEIELSEYQRQVSSGSESPSGLLNGENCKVETIADLDLFFERLYNYYCEKGLWCIVVKWIFELLSLGFVICFSGFFLLFVDWNGLRNAKCGIDAVESGNKPCDLAKVALRQHPLVPFSLLKFIVVGYLGIFSIYWIFCFLKFFAQLKNTLVIRHFYYNSLHVTDHEIQTTQWASILEKVVQIQRSQQLCVVKDLSTHDIVMRIMRKENYLIGMINKGILAFPIYPWIPGAGPPISSGVNGRKNYLILTKTLEWTLNWCILQSMFDRNFHVRKDFIYNPSSLRKRIMAVGILMILLLPFLCIFMLVYLFLRHAEQLCKHPSIASSRRWSNLSKWVFREFNEVGHLFKHRTDSSVVHAANYLKHFPSPILTIIAKFISFVSGGFAAVLIIIAFLEESLLEGHIYGRNLLWYAAVFGTVTAISRAAVVDELQVLDPEGAMSLVVQYTHYMPKRWRGKENTDMVRTEFEALFQYTGMMLLEEMASILSTPYVLLLHVPKRVDDILQFISDFTVDIEGVGDVCSLSAFDFENHGNSNYASPNNVPRTQRSSQGKMEKSFLSFQSSYATSEPNAQGRKLLCTLDNFIEHKLQSRGAQQVHNHPMTWNWTPNLMHQGEFQNFITRDVLYNKMEDGQLSGYQLCPYVLDWYYTSKPLLNVHHSEGNPILLSEVSKEPFRDFPMEFNTSAQTNRLYEEDWSYPLEEGRVESHMEASTSTPFFQECVLHHPKSDHLDRPRETQWWARGSSHSVGPQTSFLEPPNFFALHEPPDFGHHISASTHSAGPETSFLEPPNINHHTSVRAYDICSNKSTEDQEEHHFDWNSRSLSKTAYLDDIDLEEGQFSLPFEDIYSKPLRIITSRSEPADSKYRSTFDTS
ncbi:hypothetical protein GIB67_043031 [Kingdonia uniflora]|uniref:Autophagy-related protein 9 n=1 Tax=Kingdonia uniflora TaxID=39325 RepID=A0A7J7NT40_9MAGN|nr:hypothetical protein GIB67_043031 [Kingdonia uniflora]